MTAEAQLTQGEQAVLSEPPVLTFGGRQYTLHKLGLKSQAPLARIVATAISRKAIEQPSDLFVMGADGAPQIGPAGGPMLNIETAGKLFLSACGWCEDDVFLLLSQLLGVSIAELQDPELFSLVEIMGVFGGLLASPDVTGFLRGGRAAASSGELPAEPSPSAAPST